MNKSRLPPVLTRRDFDSGEEYDYYLASEAEDYELPTDNIEKIRENWQTAANRTINGKRERITIAIPERNLTRLKSMALRRGIPYQTLINEVLHEHIKLCGGN